MSEKTFFQIKELKSESLNSHNLGNINLDLKRGEVYALVGKSEYEINAFMKAIYELKEPAEGEIFFKGRRIYGNSIKKNAKIAFLFRKAYLFEHMSVAENISLAFIPKLKGIWSANLLKGRLKAKETLEELNIQINHQEVVNNLSREQQKLVSIARAFYNKPEIVIMNDPMEALSSKSIKNIYDIIYNFKTNNGSIIYLTQHWEEALKIADRISVLSGRQIDKVFLAEDVRRNPLQLLDCLGYYNYKKKLPNIEPEVKEILDSVLKAAEFITSEYELKDVLSLLSEQVVRYMNADGCIIYLIDEETKTVIDKYELKVNGELYATLRDDVVIRIAAEGDFFYSNMHEKDFTSFFSCLVSVKTVVCSTLLVRTRVIGVMQVYYEKYYAHSEEQTKYLKTFANHAGVAIEDTRLIGRSALLQESHHRIKNNLQSVINLILLQKQSVDNGQNETLNNALNDIISRIKSIATVHDLLSKDKKGRSVINIKEIVESIASFSTLISSEVNINLYLEDILIPYNKATSIALIINELISNCVKHAFKEDKVNIITISCRKENEAIILGVENNGQSIPEDFNIDKVSGLGLSIVTSIIKHEFKGIIKFIKKEEGTKVKIVLPLEKILIE